MKLTGFDCQSLFMTSTYINRINISKALHLLSTLSMNIITSSRTRRVCKQILSASHFHFIQLLIADCGALMFLHTQHNLSTNDTISKQKAILVKEKKINCFGVRARNLIINISLINFQLSGECRAPS